MNKKIVQVLLLGTVFLTACGGGDRNAENVYFENAVGASEEYGSAANADDMAYEMTSQDVTPAGDWQENGLDDQMTLERKLIKNATLSFETDSLGGRKLIVNSAVEMFNAYVAHEEQYSSPYEETVSTIIRVPAENFDAFMEAISVGVGSFDTKTIEVDDVTEEYVDVAARIQTKKELKTRFIALLDKAETIAKIMEVEREISALQAEIESYEGRLKYLKGSVKYATVNLTYYRTLDVPVEFDNKFESAFFNGWRGTVWFFVGVVSIWPLIIIISIVLIFLRFKLRKSKI